MLRCCLFALLLAIPGTMARACDTPIEFDDAEATALLQEVSTASESDFAAVLEFNRLLCAQRKIIRDLARQEGAKSDIPAIRAATLDSAIFEKDVLNLQVVPEERMTERQKEFLQTNPLISYDVEFRDMSKGCISLYDKNKCNPSYMASTSGSELDLVYDYIRSKLRLEEDGVLRGIWSNGSVNDPVSVRVELRLD